MLEKIINEVKEQNIILLEQLNSGGQKQVFKVKVNNEECLLKVISLFPANLNKNNFDEEQIAEIEDEIEARLKRELKLMKLCENRFPKILHFDNYKIVDFNENKYAYYFEEFLNGNDLAKEMKIKSSYSLKDIIIYLHSMINNLICMNEHNIIHRDIKPQNIIVVEDDYILIDLGLCRQTYEDETLTISFQKLGTISYLSPEQRKGVKTDYKWDFRNDLYATGLIAMEMFIPETRVIRYENINLKNLKNLWYAKSTSSVEKLFFDTVILKLLAEERFGRFKSINEIKEVIDNLEVEVK